MRILDGIQSVFNPQSPDAAAIAELTWVLIIGGGIVFALVLTAAWIAIRGRPAWLGSHRTILVGGIAFPAVVVFALMLYSLSIAPGRDAGPSAMRIEITGHQWWWRVRYLDASGGVDFETANELRIPVGTPVAIELRSDDVLHSFWVPTLAGKLDLVPGRVNRMRLSADRPGRYRGQCAEYCGGPHAQMALYVVAQDAEDFERWRARQRQPAAQANTLFAEHCAVCHTIRGTDARGTLGPDLTHVGGRVSIGAGILPNNPGTLAAWIASSQHIKPGNLMPAFGGFSSEALTRLADYLAGLE